MASPVWNRRRRAARVRMAMRKVRRVMVYDGAHYTLNTAMGSFRITYQGLIPLD